jgi:hypothetical protein
VQPVAQSYAIRRLGTFSATGSLAGARAGRTATLLSDGTVLIAGGGDFSGNILAAAEVFNPTNATFAGTGALQAAREGHTATLLKDGSVLVTGQLAKEASYSRRRKCITKSILDGCQREKRPA